MPLGGSWTVASMTPVTSKLGRATITKGQRQFVAGPAGTQLGAMESNSNVNTIVILGKVTCAW